MRTQMRHFGQHKQRLYPGAPGFLWQTYWPTHWRKWLIATVVTYSFATPSAAQTISADGTLSTTVSSTDNQNFTITDGDRAGNNLFHSFESFSVPATFSAFFDNPTDIVNIFSRVTGDISTIDGLIRANGTANLFLINPHGLVIGPNAQLDIGGSFIGTTAENVAFADDVEFSAIAPTALLTVSTPTGLQLGASSQSIQVNDTGYQYIPATFGVDSGASLQVKPGNTLALIGNGVTLTGGVLAAPAGHIELGSVQQGLVDLDSNSQTPSQWNFGYDDIQRLGDLMLSAHSLLNTSDLLFTATALPLPISSGAHGGSIQLQGSQIALQEGSLAFIQNFGDQNFGNIRVRASDTIVLDGKEVTRQLRSGFSTINYGNGLGGNIEVIAPQVEFIRGSGIRSETYGASPAGNISMLVEDTIHFKLADTNINDSGTVASISGSSGITGDLNISTRNLTIAGEGISSRTVGSGTGGNVTVKADNLTITHGGTIASATLGITLGGQVGAGSGGNVYITSDVININGVAQTGLFPSTIGVGTTQSGNAGNLEINTRQLNLQDGGRIDASTLASGNAGTVTINATESVNVNGTVPGSINPSLIISSANEIDPELRQFFANENIFVPTLPSGDSGNVNITTPTLTVNEGAQVTVRNDGSGDAGHLTVNANTVNIKNNAGITASTQTGSGGNIILNLEDNLLLRQAGRLSAEAGGMGDGGNITLTAPVIIALENSDIIANAVKGTGGNIQVNTQGLIGTEFRDRLTAESDITASSEFGGNGVVEITAVETDPSSGIVALPENLVDSSDQIVAGCSSNKGSQFIATGHGGLPTNPTREMTAYRLWSDVRSPITSAPPLTPNQTTAATSPATPQPQITEASTWEHNSQGDITLLALAEHQSLDTNTQTTCLKDAMAQTL